MPVVNLAIDYLLWKSGEKKAAFPEQGIANELPLTGWAERMEAVRRLMEWCERQRLDTKAKDDFARSIAQRFHLDYDELLRSRMLQIMRPDELAQAARMGVDIQLHTHRHRTPLNRELFLEEIKLNRERINDITGKSPTHFCYPSGQYDRDFFPWLEECGIESATTCVRGFADPTSDPYLVPRVLDDSNMSELEFEGVVSGLLA